MTILLAKRPFVLDTLTVVGERARFRPPLLDGFYQRRSRGWGAFLAREEIEARGAYRFTQLLGTMRGVRLVRLPVREGGLQAIRHYTLRIVGKPRYCVPLLWVDGVLWGPVDQVTELGVDVALFPSELEAVEVYRRASELPPEFGGSDAMCGVIVVWTRRSPDE